jgi:acyl-CoA synthetase (AMP-forming)/AMP-acid ligase II
MAALGGIHMPNVPELVVAYHSCLRTGVVAVPLNVRLTSSELHRMLRRLRPKLYLGHSDVYAAVDAIDTTIASDVLADVALRLAAYKVPERLVITERPVQVRAVVVVTATGGVIVLELRAAAGDRVRGAQTVMTTLPRALPATR